MLGSVMNRPGQMAFTVTPRAAQSAAVDRGDIDDAPLAAGEHRAADDLRADEAVREIEIDEALPGLELGILDRRIDLAVADIVDQNVDRPSFRKHALAKAFAQGGPGDIAGKRPGLAPARSYLVRRLGQRVRVARVQHDIGACLRRCQRDGPADAAAAARNEQAPAVEAEPIEHVHGKIRGLLLFCTILPVYVGLPSTVALSRSF